MADSQEKINQLQARLDKMVEYQDYFYREINQIRHELKTLKTSAQTGAAAEETPLVEQYIPPKTEAKPFPRAAGKGRSQAEGKTYQTAESTLPLPRNSNAEEFVGRNLISLIGIVITIIGVGIGAKYAIDNNLISPLTRIILGYAFGFALLGFAVKLKPKYHNFSAVLLSGAMAIMYFITFFAYSLYGLFSQPAAFALMLIFTAFTVASAINYSRQVIAHIGLVGAYAIPFFLSDNSGRYDVLFGYTAIINIGILAVSLFKYWKLLFYSSFAFTWAMFAGWYLFQYNAAVDFNLALIFLPVFFLIFYVTFLGYKLFSRENVSIENIVLILANSFIFYGIGCSILESREGFSGNLGLFTFFNAALHFVFALVVSRLKNVSRDIVLLLAALVLTFLTITVPVQLEGQRVTLIWAAEAAILFWIGRTKQISLFENYSYPLMVLASISLLNDWQELYGRYFAGNEFLTPVFNPFFVVGLCFTAAFAFIYLTAQNKNYEPKGYLPTVKIAEYVVPAVLLIALYNTLRIEIGNYFHSAKFVADVQPGFDNFSTANFSKDAGLYNFIWQIDYTMLFLSVLSLVNIKRFKSFALGFINFGLSLFVLLLFLTGGLYVLGELREDYLLRNADIFHILSATFHMSLPRC